MVMGPISTTTVLPRSASRSASARPIWAATRNRLSTWLALVDSATSTSAAADRSIAALSAPLGTTDRLTRAARCRNPASSSSFRAPFS